METRKRYRDRDYVTEKQARRTGQEESAFDEVEVVEIEGPDGPMRIYKDQVAMYDQVMAEMAAGTDEEDDE